MSNYDSQYKYSENSSYINLKKFTPLQTNLVSVGLLVASFGLLAIFAIGMLVKFAIVNNLSNINYSSLYTVSGVLLLVSFVCYFIWSFKPNISFGFQVGIISTYCISTGISFGFIFALLELNTILFSFGVVSFILFICYLLSKITNEKVAMSLGKIITVFGVCYMIFMLVWMILTFLGIFSNAAAILGNNLFANEWTYFILNLLFGIVSFLIIWYSLYQLKNMDQVRNVVDKHTARSIGMLFGFSILMNIVILLRFVLYFFVRNSN